MKNVKKFREDGYPGSKESGSQASRELDDYLCLPEGEEDVTDEMRRRLYGDWSEEEIRVLVRARNVLIRRLISYNRVLPEDVTRDLARDPDVLVRLNVAIRRDLPEDLDRMLATDESEQVRDLIRGKVFMRQYSENLVIEEEVQLKDCFDLDRDEILKKGGVKVCAVTILPPGTGIEDVTLLYAWVDVERRISFEKGSRQSYFNCNDPRDDFRKIEPLLGYGSEELEPEDEGLESTVDWAARFPGDQHATMKRLVKHLAGRGILRSLIKSYEAVANERRDPLNWFYQMRLLLVWNLLQVAPEETVELAAVLLKWAGEEGESGRKSTHDVRDYVLSDLAPMVECLHLEKALFRACEQRGCGELVKDLDEFIPRFAKEEEEILNLVVVGANVGRGRRAGSYGALYGAIYDPENNQFKICCRVTAGFEDKDIDELSEILEPLERLTRDQRVISALLVEPDVWLRPFIVIGVKGDIILRRTCPAALNLVERGSGLSIRSPLFVRIRIDLRAENATTQEELIQLYKLQPRT